MAHFSTPDDLPLTTDTKAAIQELLRTGVVYEISKGNVYRTLSADRTRLATILDPLDLVAQFDDVRGIAFVAVSAEAASSDEVELPVEREARFGASIATNGPGSTSNGAHNTDEAIGAAPVGPDEAWHHPLVRRQRLTLEQSLLLAILRRHYTEHEQTFGIGALEPTVSIDDLSPDLQIYLGPLGSESAEDKRVRDLLEQLHRHSIVSTLVDDQVKIRPLICHVANPTTLSTLIDHYRSLATVDLAGNSDATGEPAEPHRPQPR